MAGIELDSFVRKFVNLWQSGCDAKLHVESEAGNAFITLRVGLGHDLLGHHHRVVRHRGGGPAKQRRRERREAERKEAAAAEEVVVGAKEKETFEVIAEEALKKSDMTEKVIGQVPNSPIPQLDGTFDDGKAHFELKVDAHEKCSNQDVIEAIKENFFGELDTRKVEKTDPVRHLIIREENDKISEVQEKYRVVVRENKVATEIVGLWNEPYEFDDLAFKNAVYGEIKINIKEVKRVR